MGDGDTKGVGDTKLTTEGDGDMDGVRDVTGDTDGDTKEDWLSLFINGDMTGDTEVTVVTFLNVTTRFGVTTGVTMSLGDISGEILVLFPKKAKRLPPYPGP